MSGKCTSTEHLTAHRHGKFETPSYPRRREIFSTYSSTAICNSSIRRIRLILSIGLSLSISARSAASALSILSFAAITSGGSLMGLGAGGFGLGARGLILPGFAQLFTAPEDIRFRFVQAGVYARAFDGVTRGAASHKIAGILLPFASARNHEINTHDQRVFKACASVQTTIPTDIIIAFENLAAFFECYWGIHQRKSSEANRHDVLRSGNCLEQEGEYDFQPLWNEGRTERGRCQDAVLVASERPSCGTLAGPVRNRDSNSASKLGAVRGASGSRVPGMESTVLLVRYNACVTVR